MWEYEAFILVFEPYLRKYFQEKIRQSNKYPSLIHRFYKDLFDFTSGGKNLRAFLVWLGYRLADGQKVEKVLPVSLAIELLHSFLLIHDDIIDQSDTRRGKPTIHKRYEKFFGPSALLRASKHYGMSQAIVLGDIACFEALGLVSSSGFTDSQKVACQKRIINSIIETGYGEALDVEYSNKGTDLKAIKQMTELKTAKYTFVGPLTIGAILGETSKSQINALTKFGLLLGMAFQLQDDILGIFGDEKIIGKSILSDLREGKNTLLVHKAKEMAKAKDRLELEQTWGQRQANVQDLKKVRQIIMKSGALAWVDKEKKRLTASAIIYVKKITKSQKLQKVVNGLVNFVITREK